MRSYNVQWNTESMVSGMHTEHCAESQRPPTLMTENHQHTCYLHGHKGPHSHISNPTLSENSATAT